VGDDLILKLLVDALHPARVFSTRAGRECGIDILDVAELPRRTADFDLLLIGGGGLLNTRWVGSLPLAALGKPYGFLSVGIPHERWLDGMDEVLAPARFVTLRDHLAQDLFATHYPRIPSWWVPDPAFMLRRRRVRPRELVTLVPRTISASWLRPEDPPDADERQIELMSRLIQRFGERAECLALGFEGHDAELLRRLPCETRIVGVEQAVDMISRSTVAVTTRLHGGIIAATQGTPVALIDYQDKMRGLSRLLDLPLFSLADLTGVDGVVEHALSEPAPRDPARAAAFGSLVARLLRLMTA
jgi:polysaccharide pyruvyl transferase WcaK-like protein